MEIHEITRRRAEQLDEVNWGAIPGALAGIAKQGIQQALDPNRDRFGPVAAVGQETQAVNAMTDTIVKNQANAAYQTWQQAIQTKLQQSGQSDVAKLGRNDIENTLKNYVNQRLTPGGQSVDMLSGPPVIKNSIKRTMDTIVANTLANKWKSPETAAAWMRLVKTVRMSINQTDTGQPGQSGTAGPSNTPGGVSLNPATQRIAQSISPYTTSIARLLPSNYNATQISPTNNSSVNAILANLGLLKGYKPGTP